MKDISREIAVPRLGIVLAAGCGSRIGGPKALLEFRGERLVERAVRTAIAGGCDHVLVVVGAAADTASKYAAGAGGEVVVNPRWAEGMGTSLQAGLSAARASALPARAALIMLVDQPLITAEAVAAVFGAHRDPNNGDILATASYRGRRGHPVLIGRSHWNELLRARPQDTGARGYLNEHRDDLVLVPCDGIADPRDLDRQEDLSLAGHAYGAAGGLFPG